jgi:hypothetical protein
MTEAAQNYAEALEHLRIVKDDIDDGLQIEHIYDYYFEIADIAWLNMTGEEQEAHS